MNSQHESSDERAPALKPAGKLCKVREQIFNDALSGLTFQFELDEHGFTRFRMFGGGVPFHNREIVFGPDGMQAATGTLTKGRSKPTWMTHISERAA